MTIITTICRVGYVGDNVSTIFPIPFEFFLTSDITAIKTSTAGTAVNLVFGVDYTLGNVGVVGGGSLIKTTALLAGENLEIILNPPINQASHYISNAPFPASTLENDIDRQTQISQRLNDQIVRAIRAPDNDLAPTMLLPPAASRANTGLVFDANGNIGVGILPTTALTQTLFNNFLALGAIGGPQTALEAAAGVAPVNQQYLQFDWRRYDTSGGTDYTAAMIATLKLGRGTLAAGVRYPVLTVGTSMALTGPYVLTGDGPSSVIACDGILFTLTGASNSLFYNFGLDSITAPQMFQRLVETTIQTTGTTVANGTSIVVASATGIVKGMRVMGPYVFNGTTVTNVSGTTITVADGSSESATGAVEFYNITNNSGSVAAATLTTTKAEGYRPVSVNDVDLLASMGSTAFNAAIAAGQKGPVLQVTGNRVVAERLNCFGTSFQFINCNFSTMRACDLQGGWTWASCAFLNFGTTRCTGNAALGNRFRHHAYEGVMLMGQDYWRVEHNYAFGVGDSGFETYQQGSTTAGAVTPNSTYFDGGIGGVSVGNQAIACYQGSFNYESNFGAGFIGYNSAMSSSTGDYSAWCPNGACAFTGKGWVISGLVCEYNPGNAMYANISNSILQNSVFRENNYGNVSSFSDITIIGSSNLIAGVRAYRETNRATNYTMNVNAGTSITSNTTMRDVDLRDAVTPTGNQLLLAAFPNNILRKNVRVGTIGSGPGTLDAPENFYAMLQQTTSQTLAAATSINVAFNVAATDPFGVCDLTNHRFSGMPSGKYKVSATVVFQSTSATAVDYYMSIAVNGYVPGANSAIQHCTPSAASQNYTLTNTEIVTIAALTDYISIIVQPYGATATIGLSASYATLERLGDY